MKSLAASQNLAQKVKKNRHTPAVKKAPGTKKVKKRNRHKPAVKKEPGTGKLSPLNAGKSKVTKSPTTFPLVVGTC